MFGFFYLVRMHKPKEPKKKEIETVYVVENTKVINNYQDIKSLFNIDE